MVHPLLRRLDELTRGDLDLSVLHEQLAEPILAMLPRLHVLVVGPGLGRDVRDHTVQAARALFAARRRGMPAVVDADALGTIAAESRAELAGWRECVLTPNVRELENLCARFGVDDDDADARAGPGRRAAPDELRAARCAALARALGGVAVLAKGPADVVSDGRRAISCAAPGAAKRSGGQGDTLTGVLATLLAWRKAYRDRLWPHDGALLRPDGDDADDTVMLCAYAASAVTRECSRLAFAEKGRSMQASDLTDKVHQAFLNVLGEPEEDSPSDADTLSGKM
jgi:ATP-dependent NAD(P)H-hydrate dehydratase